MPASDAELLETLLAKVMRLAVTHGDAPVSDHAGTSLTMAEGVLLVELLSTGEVTQQQMADRLHLDKSRVSRCAPRWSASTCWPASATSATAATSTSGSPQPGRLQPPGYDRPGTSTTSACSPR